MTVAALSIDFRLRPLREIYPWHDADGSNPHLGWFGLTDGWYWLKVGEVELFRYSRAVLDTWASTAQGAQRLSCLGGLSYVDYQVAQFWGDLLGFLPDVLAPVPPRLVFALTSGAWMEWKWEAEAAVAEALPEREARNLLYDATRWLGKRKLDSAYLISGPTIHCWSDGTQVHVQWDNQNRILDGLPLWEATAGHHALPGTAFHQAIRDFDARFMRRMADRVAIAQAEWARPDVTLAPHLAETQCAQARWAQGCLAASAPQELDNWDTTFAAIASIEALPRFASGTAHQLP
jgi:hypothetical protein